MRGSIPDLYLKGQGEYFDELRVNLGAADAGTKTAKEALDDTAAVLGAYHPPDGQAQPEGSVGLSQVDLSRRHSQSSEVGWGVRHGPLRAGRAAFIAREQRDMTTQGMDGPLTSQGQERRRFWPRFNILLVLPAQLTMMVVVIVPPSSSSGSRSPIGSRPRRSPGSRPSRSGSGTFYDLWYDDRFTNAVFRTLFVVAVCVCRGTGAGARPRPAVPRRMAMAAGRGQRHHLADDDHPGRCGQRLLHALQRARADQPSDIARDRRALRVFLAVPSDLGDGADHAGRDLAVDALDVPLVLTGLMNLPQNQVRAAIVLGASPARIFFKIMLPLLLPVISIALLIRSIETFKIFDPVYILTRGQPGGSTETISMFMYNGAFVYFRMGYIAAAALLVLVVVISICLLLARRCGGMARGGDHERKPALGDASQAHGGGRLHGDRLFSDLLADRDILQAVRRVGQLAADLADRCADAAELPHRVLSRCGARVRRGPAGLARLQGLGQCLEGVSGFGHHLDLRDLLFRRLRHPGGLFHRALQDRRGKLSLPVPHRAHDAPDRRCGADGRAVLDPQAVRHLFRHGPRLHRLYPAVLDLDDPLLHRGGALGARGRGHGPRHEPVPGFPDRDLAAHQGRRAGHRSLRLYPQLVGVSLCPGAHRRQRHTVTLQVANYVSASSGKLYGVQAAMGTISTLPVILFGYVIQRHLVRGLTFRRHQAVAGRWRWRQNSSFEA